MMVHAQLHALKVMMGMMTDKYTAKFKMLVGGTGLQQSGT